MLDMTIPALQQAYRDGRLTPITLVEHILSLCEAHSDNPIWIKLLSKEQIQVYLDRLANHSVDDLALYGIPFAIKDNIDLAGVPTTAACPEFEYTPQQSAFVVEKLIEAGAIPIGKTNLDQFATGLVGTRSPYGACKNSINPEMISGGSSSGSAVAVALGMVSFSLGTDTAGSGRIPAFLNNLVGVKPTVGSLSASGMIPACRTLDSMSIFTKDISDAETVFKQAAVYDDKDDYAKVFATVNDLPKTITVGIPAIEQCAWFGNSQSEQLFLDAIETLKSQGLKVKTIDFTPFKEAADLLYAGPWVAERYAALEDIMENRPEILYPVTRKIVSQAENYNAVDCFKSQYQLQAYKQQADRVIAEVDCIMTPTAGTYYTIAEVNADPVQLNTNLGYYTNFMNLLDYSALAVPTGFYANNMPFGVTLFAPAFNDYNLMKIAKAFEES